MPMLSIRYPRRALLLAALLATGGLLAGADVARSEDAKDYPTRAITIIVPYAAGGPTDAAVRVVAQSMGATLGKPVVIENLGGAGGAIGTLKVVNATHDGYTLLATQSGIATIPALYPKMPLNITKDLTAVGMLNRSYSFLVGRKTLPANDVPALKTWMQGPGKPALWAHPGVGSAGYINAFITAQALGAEVTLVPYKSSGAALNDVVAGHVDLVWVGSTLAIPQIQAGTIKAFAAGADKPGEVLPGVPVASTVGLEKGDNPVWQMLLAPAGTPEPVVAKLNAALRQALASPEVQKSYTAVGSLEYPLPDQTPEFANQLLSKEIERMTQVIRDNKIEAGE